MGECNAIYLVGARASGKTTVGKALAAAYGCGYVDTDAEIRKKAGMEIARIVASRGWQEFRALESAVLREIGNAIAKNATCQDNAGGQAKKMPTVVATGGGIILSKSNRDYMRSTGVVIWLAAEAKILSARLAACPAPGQRPSLTGAGIVAEVENILAEREPLYRECAHLCLDASQSPAHLCEQIRQFLENPAFAS